MTQEDWKWRDDWYLHHLSKLTEEVDAAKADVDRAIKHAGNSWNADEQVKPYQKTYNAALRARKKLVAELKAEIAYEIKRAEGLEEVPPVRMDIPKF